MNNAMEIDVENNYVIGTADPNVEIMKAGYREYLTPKSKLPIYQVGIIAKVTTFSRRYNRNTDLYVSFWATIGPNSTNLVFEKTGIPSYKAPTKIKSFSKKFPKENIGDLVAVRNIDINDFFSAYHSYLIITDWYSDQAENTY